MWLLEGIYTCYLLEQFLKFDNLNADCPFSISTFTQILIHVYYEDRWIDVSLISANQAGKLLCLASVAWPGLNDIKTLD